MALCQSPLPDQRWNKAGGEVLEGLVKDAQPRLLCGKGKTGGKLREKVVGPRQLESGSIEPAHEIEAVCANCNFDVDEAELSADTCSDCGESLNLRQSVAIKVTTVPMSGATT